MRVGSALRDALASGYGWGSFRADLLAGVVVGIVALPLSMALAIAVGVPPQHGIYTAVIAGALAAASGGSRVQVTGPTAAFVVILAPIVAKHGLSGLLTAGLMAGAMLVLLGYARLGRFVEFIPHPVTTGFTAGIATVLAVLQLKDLLGLTVAHPAEHFGEKLIGIAQALPTARPADAAIGLVTLGVLVAVPYVTRRVPAPLIALTLAALGAWGIELALPGVEVATIASRFGAAVGGGLPTPSLPWGATPLTFELINELLPAAFAIAMLGAIESLLSAVIGESMGGGSYDPDAELVGQGIANLAVPFFGGIAATGALARTATNVRSGARSPISAMIHALVVLLAMVLLAPLLGRVPMAALAAVLLVVAYNMSELQHVRHLVKVAPRSDLLVLATCYGLTVFADMVVAIGVGIVLAAMLFMRRMAALTHSEVLDGSRRAHGHGSEGIPQGVVVYDVLGPLFFGAARRAMTALSEIRDHARVVIIDLGAVPVIDATGFAALEGALNTLHKLKKLVILAGPLPAPQSFFARARLEASHPHVMVVDDRAAALTIATDLALLNPDWAEPSTDAPPRAE